MPSFSSDVCVSGFLVSLSPQYLDSEWDISDLHNNKIIDYLQFHDDDHFHFGRHVEGFEADNIIVATDFV
jgi:hypothetical protein